MSRDASGCFRVYKVGTHPKPKRDFIKIDFMTRKSARHYCRARPGEEWHIVLPDGTDELVVFN